MTENEAIQHARKVAEDKRADADWRWRHGRLNSDDCIKCAEEHEQLANWIEELQQYRAIGAVKEIKKLVQFLSIDNDREIIKELEELRDYVSIGTVEECREARERQRAKKPNIYGDGYDDEGKIIYDMYDCPNCNKSYELDYEEYDFCPNCGQAIDWSEDK